jgi:hypothetical protein
MDRPYQMESCVSASTDSRQSRKLLTPLSQIRSFARVRGFLDLHRGAKSWRGQPHQAVVLGCRRERIQDALDRLHVQGSVRGGLAALRFSGSARPAYARPADTDRSRSSHPATRILRDFVVRTAVLRRSVADAILVVLVAARALRFVTVAFQFLVDAGLVDSSGRGRGS